MSEISRNLRQKYSFYAHPNEQRLFNPLEVRCKFLNKKQKTRALTHSGFDSRQRQKALSHQAST